MHAMGAPEKSQEEALQKEDQQDMEEELQEQPAQRTDQRWRRIVEKRPITEQDLRDQDAAR